MVDTTGVASFIGRGFDLRVGVPLGESLARALTRTAGEVVEACPTGALAWRLNGRSVRPFK